MGPRAVAVACASSVAGVVPRQSADCLQVPLRRGPVPIVTRRFVRAAHRAGLPVHVWTINDEPTMHALLDLGVDGVMTDRPRLLRAVFESRGLSLDGTRS
jgi:glycerophosphoryl diester phosphodiesterase